MAVQAQNGYQALQHEAVLAKAECKSLVARQQKDSLDVSQNMKAKMERLGNFVMSHFQLTANFPIHIMMSKEPDMIERGCCWRTKTTPGAKTITATVDYKTDQGRRTDTIHGWDREITAIAAAHFAKYERPEDIVIELQFNCLLKSSGGSAH